MAIVELARQADGDGAQRERAWSARAARHQARKNAAAGLRRGGCGDRQGQCGDRQEQCGDRQEQCGDRQG
eukprot:58270-Chlamydomonas_euryale.AAC.1